MYKKDIPIQIDKIHSNLYISACVCQENISYLEHYGVKAIVNLVPYHNYDPKSIIYLHEPFDDNTYISSEKLERIYRFIDYNIKKGIVLVHCAMGISRSGGIVAGQILRENPNWTWEESVIYVNQFHHIEPEPLTQTSIIDFLSDHQ